MASQFLGVVVQVARYCLGLGVKFHLVIDLRLVLLFSQDMHGRRFFYSFTLAVPATYSVGYGSDLARYLHDKSRELSALMAQVVRVFFSLQNETVRKLAQALESQRDN